MSAKHPAAWINAVAEGRDVDEALMYLQQTWDQLCDANANVMELTETVNSIAEFNRTLLAQLDREHEAMAEASALLRWWET
jgi:hypothetical protein